MGDFVRADVIAHVIGRCYCLHQCNSGDKTLHHLCTFVDGRCCCLVARWNSHFYLFKVGRCYCHVVWWKNHICTVYGRCLLPSGRCYSHYLSVWQQMIWPSGRWNNHSEWVMCLVDLITKLADGIAMGSVYVNLSSEVLYRTSSQICGRRYLPIFLFRDGLLTLI